MVFVFYQVGKRIDFSGSYGLLAALAFMGALIGNLPGFYVYASESLGVGWGSGFGYVTSFGIPEPSSIINLFTAAVGTFMIPIAGLALAHFRFQFDSVLDETSAGAARAGRISLLTFIVSFLIVSTDYPLAILARNLLQGAAPIEFPVRDFSKELIPGYVGFLIFPALFLLAFFLVGTRLDLGLWGPSKFEGFALSLFLGGVTGILINSVYAVINSSFLGQSFVSLVLSGVYVLVLGFGAVSLGFIRKRNQRPL
jgi:hypothetical protein